MPNIDSLRIFQSYPLEIKIKKTQLLIKEWINNFGIENVYISFSGGKDSTVLLDITRKIFPKIKACYCCTGLEYSETQKFVKNFDNVDIVYPKMSFKDVITEYGYPFISKDVASTIYYYKKGSLHAHEKLFGINSKTKEISNYRLDRYSKWLPLVDLDFNISHICCLKTKEEPINQYGKNMFPLIGTLAEESELRTQAWLKTGCNAFNSKRKISKPLSFWTEQDILKYIKIFNLPLNPHYGEIVYVDEMGFEYENIIDNCLKCKLKTTKYNRQGCVFCGFGAHNDKVSRFKRLKINHPKQYYYCLDGGQYNENGIWVPSTKGLGMAHCIDEINKIYEKNLIEY